MCVCALRSVRSAVTQKFREKSGKEFEEDLKKDLLEDDSRWRETVGLNQKPLEKPFFFPYFNEM